MFGVPAMFQFMSQHPAFADTDLSSVRLLIVGGAPCPLPVLKTYLARGVSMQQGYGLTETAPMVSFLAPEHALSKVGSSGKPPLFVEVRIVDPSGRTIEAPKTQGEILVRGPNVTPGYWDMPQATALAIDKEGWFRTGDAGFFDEEGFLTISDRIKDMIITGGENVYPAEVESALMRHPAIAEVAVIGEPHDQWGEGIVAIAALKPGQSLTLETLREFAGESLARYKLPGRLEIVPVLPRNATGKIQISASPDLCEGADRPVAGLSANAPGAPRFDGDVISGMLQANDTRRITQSPTPRPSRRRPRPAHRDQAWIYCCSRGR